MFFVEQGAALGDTTNVGSVTPDPLINDHGEEDPSRKYVRKGVVLLNSDCDGSASVPRKKATIGSRRSINIINLSRTFSNDIKIEVKEIMCKKRCDLVKTRNTSWNTALIHDEYGKKEQQNPPIDVRKSTTRGDYTCK